MPSVICLLPILTHITVSIDLPYCRTQSNNYWLSRSLIQFYSITILDILGSKNGPYSIWAIYPRVGNFLIFQSLRKFTVILFSCLAPTSLSRIITLAFGLSQFWFSVTMAAISAGCLSRYLFTLFWSVIFRSLYQVLVCF